MAPRCMRCARVDRRRPRASLARRSGRTSCGCRARTTARNSALTAIATARRRPWTPGREGRPLHACLGGGAGLRAVPDRPSSPASCSRRPAACTCGARCRSGAPVRMFPALLREAGYYTTNNVKEDYNHPTPAGRLGRVVADRALARASPRAAVLRGVQQRDHAREPDPQAPAHCGARSGDGARAAVSPRHSRKSGRTGRSTTTSSRRWTPKSLPA